MTDELIVTHYGDDDLLPICEDAPAGKPLSVAFVREQVDCPSCIRELGSRAPISAQSVRYPGCELHGLPANSGPCWCELPE